MERYNFVFAVGLLLFSFGCQNTTDFNIDEDIKEVSVKSSEVFEYRTGKSGDEEEAIIKHQTEHHEISEIVRDSTTNWEAVYRYKPKSGFQGTDHVEIKVETGSDGASPNTNIKFIKIEITVN